MRDAAGGGEFTDAGIIGAEVVAPLRDAVSLVDDQQRRRIGGDHFAEAASPQAFRAGVEEADASVQGALDDLALSVDVLSRIDPRCRNAAGVEGVNLVFHQGDQRRDDDGVTRAKESGELVAQRFAGAGGHDDEHVFTGGDGADRRELAFHEVFKAEMLLQSLAELFGAHESVSLRVEFISAKKLTLVCGIREIGELRKLLSISWFFMITAMALLGEEPGGS